jgi:membrane associated rhomboid family serine protease
VFPLRDANPTRRRPIVTLALVGAIAAAFGHELTVEVSEGSAGIERLFTSYGLVPARLSAMLEGSGPAGPVLLTLVTHQFLHAGLIHAGGNLLYLWIFGNNVEDRLGRPAYLAFFVAAGVVAGLAQAAVDPTSTLPLVGASGAISALLGTYLVLFPGARIMSLVFLVVVFQIVSVPAVVLLVFWFVLQVIDGLLALGSAQATTGGVAFFAHIGGFLAGVAFGLVVRSLERRRGFREPIAGSGGSAMG